MHREDETAGGPDDESEGGAMTNQDIERAGYEVVWNGVVHHEAPSQAPISSPEIPKPRRVEFVAPKTIRRPQTALAASRTAQRIANDRAVYEAMSAVPVSIYQISGRTGLPRWTVERSIWRLHRQGTVIRVQLARVVTHGRLAFGYARV